jgi:hypothetical protein
MMVDPFTLIEPALVVVRAYQVKYRRVPGALVDAVIAEIEKLPLSIQIAIYQRILCDYADIAEHFVDGGGDDGDEEHPAKGDGDDKKQVTVSRLTGLQSSEGYHQ